MKKSKITPKIKTVTPNHLKIKRVFSTENIHPFDQITWERRNIDIKDDKGKAIFTQKDAEVPKDWSQLATKIVVSKYFWGDHSKGERETSIKPLINRVCKTIADWAILDGYLTQADSETFYSELTWLCVNQYMAFNSPVWFNTGLWQQYKVGGASGIGNYHYNPETKKATIGNTQYEYPQTSACFIQEVEDTMQSIMGLAVSEAMLFKFGSGTGTDLTPLRSSREKINGGGYASGPLSFLRVYDQVANVVKSGGKTRRAAKMNTLRDWHGDIEEFIECKAKEEKKAWALIEQGYESNFNGEAYGSVMFQNENLSVRASDEFMKAAIAREEWWTHAVTTKKPLEKKNAGDLLDKMAEGTWICGDPGIQFDGQIQKWHTCKASGPINATNPCSEYVFLNNTACNLASLNLRKFRKDHGEFDIQRFEAAAKITLLAQEILIDRASYPTEAICVNSHLFRTTGLGYANLGALIMSYGLPYDSEEGTALAGAITAIMTGAAYSMSTEIAKVKGTFEGYLDPKPFGYTETPGTENKTSMLAVIRQHKEAVLQIGEQTAEAKRLKNRAIEIWTEVENNGNIHGFRNAQVTVLAPTGTIGYLMDCDTTGIEPDIALVKYKLLAGGGNLTLVNNTVEMALNGLGYKQEEQQNILNHIKTYETIEDVVLTPEDDLVIKQRKQIGTTIKSGLKPEHLPVFDCAFKAQRGTRSIHYLGHLKMMAAAQPFISGAISKTVNVPKTTTPEEIREVYIKAWKMGLKCVAIYRDESKRSQPLKTGKAVEELAEELKAKVARLEKKLMETETKLGHPLRSRMPDNRPAMTHKFNIGGQEGYLTIGFYAATGLPGEIFLRMSKQGSTVAGLVECIGTLMSLALQYGVPLDVLVNKFSHTRFEPEGFTSDPNIKSATSVIDYVVRWMESQFMPKLEAAQDQKELALNANPVENAINTDETSQTTAKAIVAAVEEVNKIARDARTNGKTPESRHIAARTGKVCSVCGSDKLTITGSCATCRNCGQSQGCS